MMHLCGPESTVVGKSHQDDTGTKTCTGADMQAGDKNATQYVH